MSGSIYFPWAEDFRIRGLIQWRLVANVVD